jgi:hypothetical protein
VKYRWQKNDPKHGIDFKVWKQEAEDIGESECDSKGGVYQATYHGSGGKCYTYEILKRVCLKVKYVEYPDDNYVSWEYTGGCYTNEDLGVYEKAVKGEVYLFEEIEIEVREDESIISSGVSNTMGTGLATVFLVAGIACGAAFAYFYF